MNEQQIITDTQWGERCSVKLDKLLFSTLQKLQIPTIIFINKIDRAGVNLERLYMDIKTNLSQDVLFMQTVVDDLFREAGARRIYGFVEDDNIRSKRLCERLGMRREGCFKEFVTFVNNPDGSPKYEDTCVYAILEKEWNTIRQW